MKKARGVVENGEGKNPTRKIWLETRFLATFSAVGSRLLFSQMGEATNLDRLFAHLLGEVL